MPAYSGGKTCLLGQTKGCAVSANSEETRAGTEEEDDRNKAAAGEVGHHLTYATCRAGSGQGGRGGGEGARRTGTEEGTARQAGSQEGRGTVRSTGSEDGAQRGCPRGQGLHIHRDLPQLSLR